MSESTKKKIIIGIFITAMIIEGCLALFYGSSSMSLIEALVIELFVTPHVILFVFAPLARLISDDKEKVKKNIKKMLKARLIFLLIFDMSNLMSIAIIDAISLFVGAFIVVPISTLIMVKSTNTPSNTSKNPIINKKKSTILPSLKKSQEEIIKKDIETTEEKDYVKASSFDQIFSLSDNKMLETFISKSLKKAGIEQDTKMLPRELIKRKTIFCLILCILIFVYMCMIFFHFPILTYIIGAIIITIFAIKTEKYNIMEYLKKEVKSRPEEKISYIVSSAKENLVQNDKRVIIIGSIIASIVLPLIIFRTPRILYEKMDNGYGVRFYMFGLSSLRKAEIPASYKGEPVISLRGNTFSNMPFLEEVKLPETLTEIRGQAFKNDFSLKKVNIPQKLEYLGGGAFYNCTSLTSIVLPDTLTTMGGEVFKKAKSLKNIKLSEKLTEIRGNSFEECTSLETITIPDKITRIGGHAFYGAKSLSKVIFTANSQIREIGSSAFRKCNKLYSITIPKGTSVNERAFKESPTSIRYFGYGQTTEFMHVTAENTEKEIKTEKYGVTHLKVNEVKYTDHGSWYEWKVNISITGGINQNITLYRYRREELIAEDYYIEIHDCNSDGTAEISISYT